MEETVIEQNSELHHLYMMLKFKLASKIAQNREKLAEKSDTVEQVMRRLTETNYVINTKAERGIIISDKT